MPALIAAACQATIVWLGRVEDRARALPSVALPVLDLGFDGPGGESHAGLTRLSCSRVLELYPRHTPIRNTRQISILSAEELDLIAENMGAPRFLPVFATTERHGLRDAVW